MLRKTQLFYDSFHVIQNSISNRHLNKDDLPFERTKRDIKNANEKKELKNQEYRVFTKSQLRNLKNDSPFSKYFKNIIVSWKREIQQEIDDSSVNKNIFYNPKLFEEIQDYLYLIPFWTKILIKNQMPHLDLSRLSGLNLNNNPVENYFDILKNKMLGTISYPSEICAKSYLRLEYKYTQFYEKRKDELSPNLTSVDFQNDEGKKFCFEI